MFIGSFRRIFRSSVYPLTFGTPERSPNNFANGRHIDVPRVSWLKLSPDLYKAHLRFFEHTKNLVRKLEMVLDDFEHQLSLEEGQELGFSLPSQEDFRDFVGQYKAHFEEFNPYYSHTIDGFVWLSGDQVRAFIDNRKLAADLYDMLDEAIFETEYMNLIRHLKQLGIPYAGPSIFQEIVDWQAQAAVLFNIESETIKNRDGVGFLLRGLKSPENGNSPPFKRDAAPRGDSGQAAEDFMARLKDGLIL